MIQIQYYGSIRAAAGKNEEALECSPGTAVFRFLISLCSSRGGDFRDELLDGDRLRDDIAVSLNGAMVQHEAANKTLLQEGDTLALFPMLLGGG